MINRSIAMLLPVLALSACDIAERIDGEEPQSYAAMLAAGFDIAGAYPDGTLTDPVALPTEGSASYDGYWSYFTESEVGDDPTAIGEMTLNVDFDGVGEVRGSVDNLTLQNGAVYDGTLAVVGGAIDRSATGEDPQFVASVNGNLALGVEEYAVTGEVQGQFFGETGEAVKGTGDGTVTGVDGSEGWTSVFVAEAQP